MKRNNTFSKGIFLKTSEHSLRHKDCKALFLDLSYSAVHKKRTTIFCVPKKRLTFEAIIFTINHFQKNNTREPSSLTKEFHAFSKLFASEVFEQVNMGSGKCL